MTARAAVAFVLAFAGAFEARPGIAGETLLHDAAFGGMAWVVDGMAAGWIMALLWAAWRAP